MSSSGRAGHLVNIFNTWYERHTQVCHKKIFKLSTFKFIAFFGVDWSRGLFYKLRTACLLLPDTRLAASNLRPLEPDLQRNPCALAIASLLDGYFLHKHVRQNTCHNYCDASKVSQSFRPKILLYCRILGLLYMEPWVSFFVDFPKLLLTPYILLNVCVLYSKSLWRP